MTIKEVLDAFVHDSSRPDVLPSHRFRVVLPWGYSNRTSTREAAREMLLVAIQSRVQTTDQPMSDDRQADEILTLARLARLGLTMRTLQKRYFSDKRKNIFDSRVFDDARAAERAFDEAVEMALDRQPLMF